MLMKIQNGKEEIMVPKSSTFKFFGSIEKGKENKFVLYLQIKGKTYLVYEGNDSIKLGRVHKALENALINEKDFVDLSKDLSVC